MAQIKARELLKLIPDEILDKIGKDVEVDKVNQQLTGKTIFNALLFSLSQTTRMSLRMLEKTYNSAMFQQFSDIEPNEKVKGRHSSFADRLSKIKVEYFEKIFSHLVSTYHKKTPPTILNKIYKFDPTLIGISSKLFNGIYCGGSDREKSYLKIIVGQKGDIPSSVYFCTNQAEMIDDKVIPNAIMQADIEPNDIITFDRGVKAAATYHKLTDSNILFVTRARVNRKHKVIEINSKLIEPSDDIISDEIIVLKNKTTKQFFSEKLRLVKVFQKSSTEELWLLTNIFDLSPQEISKIYQRRWDIEVLFRFIKQELNLKHFLARNMNGMMVYIYMILIMAILLLMYKTANSLVGYKLAKIDFFQEIENEIICDLIRVSGGNPNIFLERFGLL